MSSTDGHILQLFVQKDKTFAVLNNVYSSLKIVNEANVEKALLLAIKEYKGIHFKAVGFIFNHQTLETQPLRLKCQKLCDEYGYFYHFSSMFGLAFNSVLSINKIMVNQGENIVCCFMNNDQTSSFIFARNENSYRYKDGMACEISSKSARKAAHTISSLIEKHDAKKIIYVMNHTKFMPINEYVKELAAKLKDTFPMCDMLMFEENVIELSFDATYRKVMNAMEVKKDTYLIDPMFGGDFSLLYNGERLIDEPRQISLPYEKTVTFKVNSKDDYVELKEDETKVIEKKLLTNFVSKEVTVSLKIDIKHTYTISIDSLEVKKIADIFKETMKLEDDNKPKIVLTLDNFSIWIPKDGKMCPLNVNGKEESPFYISFTEKKPIVGEAAKDLSKLNFSFISSCIVYDLIKLCSIKDPKEANPKWQFLVKFDENGKILIEFETVEGKKKATPAFLLALIFRDCKSRIKKEMGQGINELEIQIVGIKQEAQLLQTIKEAAELDNIKPNIVFM